LTPQNLLPGDSRRVVILPNGCAARATRLKLRSVELLATCWTSAGNVRPGVTPDESPVPIADRIAAVAAAGYSGIGFELADLEVARATIGFATLRRMIADAGMTRIEVEYLNDWWIDGPRRAASDSRRVALLEAASALGAHHIKLGTGQPGDTRDPETLRREFSMLAEDAAAAGTRIALEPGAGSGLHLLRDAIPLVLAIASPAVGILLDPWHLVRDGIPYGAVVDALPSNYLIAVELSDAAAEPTGTFFDDTFDNRVAPGSGDFDVPAFVRAVRTIGYEGPWGVEIMSTRSRSLPIDVALAEAAAGARECFEDA
jgi:sugar phosphate isomerase/epimerase